MRWQADKLVEITRTSREVKSELGYKLDAILTRVASFVRRHGDSGHIDANMCAIMSGVSRKLCDKRHVVSETCDRATTITVLQYMPYAT